jgi:purine-nucleoside phosphorylase
MINHTMTLYEKIEESAAFIQKKTDVTPSIGIILGTGLGSLAEHIKDPIKIPYRNIPHFALSTVESHAGELIIGMLAGKPVVAMRGRFHLYEGYSPEQVTFPVRVMKRLGIGTLIVSNACGGIREDLDLGAIMAITDHINLLGVNPLIGKNDERLGVRFPDMSQPYSRELIERATQAAKDLGIPLAKGIYAATTGPNLETAAEYRMLERIGADVIGMSTVPEVIVAVHAGLRVLGLSVITDKCRPESLKPVDIKKIIAVAEKAEPQLVRLILETLKRL